MMGRKSQQLQMIILDMDQIIPKNHLLQKISDIVSFDFIYQKTEQYYSKVGRPSIDPVCMIKMLLVGYLYGVKSERQLEEEVMLNIAYRWFCGFDLNDRIPDHSTFSQNRRRRFKDSQIFREIFNEIILQCIEKGLVTGDKVVSDGSFIPANVAWSSKVEIKAAIEQSTVKYMDVLDEDLRNLPGYEEPVPNIIEKIILKSSTDPECGYIHQDRKKGLGYLTEMTVDTKHGIITGVDCYPANIRESDIILEHLKRQMDETGIRIKEIALDAGYDVGAVHRGCELLGITDYCSIREIHNNAMKKGFRYDSKNDMFVCEKGKNLTFAQISYKRSSQNYYRLYRILRKECNSCERLGHCAVDKGSIRINASGFYPAYYANRKRYETEKYKIMKRLRSIWSEGTFAALKNQHNLNRAKKRGIHCISEECLLSALALNLKRMVKAVWVGSLLYFKRYLFQFS